MKDGEGCCCAGFKPNTDLTQSTARLAFFNNSVKPTAKICLRYRDTAARKYRDIDIRYWIFKSIALSRLILKTRYRRY